MKSGRAGAIILGLIYIALQVVLFRNIALFDTAFAFIYVAIVLSVPLETDRIITIFLAFVVGVLVDVFYNSLGIHASALVATDTKMANVAMTINFFIIISLS